MLILPEKGACFVCIPKTGTQAISLYLEKHLRDEQSKVFPVESLHDYHANLQEVEDTGLLPFSIYDTWTFAVVRNPFERLVSYCASFDPEFQFNPHESIKRHLLFAMDGLSSRWLLPQVFFTAGVKSIYRFEDLDGSLEAIKIRLGIDDSESMPKVNESFHERYPAYFDADAKVLAEAVYADDLREFGYKF